MFDPVYLSADDDALIAGALSADTRMSCVTAMADSAAKSAYIREHMVPPQPLSYLPLREGDRFDLGGGVLEALAFPGHTPGSVVFLDERDDCVFAGDSVTDMPWLFLPESLTVSRYLESLTRFAAKSARLSQIYPGHSITPFARSILDDLRQGCLELLAGAAKVPFTTFAGDAYSHVCGKVNLIYDPDKVR